jgi:DNA invertase Pin-like site-specific DNA recombinase
MERIVAIYARQSLYKQDSVSIETQIDQCKSFAKDKKIEIYYDKGWSGKNIARPEMQRLISDIKENKIETVISYRLDRISRNIVDFGKILELLEQYKVSFISATEQFDTSTPIGRAMIYIVATFAALERETIAQRISDNYKFRASKGVSFMGGNTPFGYRTEKESIESKKVSVLKIKEDEADLLKRIFNSYTHGESIFRIVKNLNEEGKRTSRGNLFTQNGIKRILSNMTPCVADEKMHEYLQINGYNLTNNIDEFTGENGMLLFLKNKNKNRETEVESQLCVVGIHNPIITSDIWIRAQIILNGNKNKISAKRSQKTYLTGLVECGSCKASFGIKTTNKKNMTYGYYFCRGRSNRGGCSNDLYLKYDEFEDKVIVQVLDYLNNLTLKETIGQDLNSQKVDETAYLLEQIDNIILNIGKGNSVVDDLLTNKIVSLQSKIREIEKNNNNEKYKQNRNTKIKNLVFNFGIFDTFNIEEKTTIIRQVVEKIIIYEDGRINIRYKI